MYSRIPWEPVADSLRPSERTLRTPGIGRFIVKREFLNWKKANCLNCKV